MKADFDTEMALLNMVANREGIGDVIANGTLGVLKKFGREKLIAHVNCLRGSLQQQMLPIITGVAELTYCHSKGRPEYHRIVQPIIRKFGVKGELGDLVLMPKLVKGQFGKDGNAA
jgi:aldehyde:ferredoxin oxidoreductase